MQVDAPLEENENVEEEHFVVETTNLVRFWFKFYMKLLKTSNQSVLANSLSYPDFSFEAKHWDGCDVDPGFFFQR